MELINYSIAAVVVFLGPFMGAVLAFISPEELKLGKKYFILLRNVMYLFPILVSVGFTIYTEMSYMLGVLLVLLVLMYFIRKHKYTVAYVILAVAFYLSSIKQEIFLIVGSMIFIYGLAAGTLLAEKNVKKKAQVMWNVFVRSVWFAVVSLTLYFIQFFRT